MDQWWRQQEILTVMTIGTIPPLNCPSPGLMVQSVIIESVDITELAILLRHRLFPKCIINQSNLQQSNWCLLQVTLLADIDTLLKSACFCNVDGIRCINILAVEL